ncbi:MAG: hypothetical protein J5883_05560 [Clostridiales bacterium]|nr:hypothetical protein [Clostridiales bacterium]
MDKSGIIAVCSTIGAVLIAAGGILKMGFNRKQKMGKAPVPDNKKWRFILGTGCQIAGFGIIIIAFLVVGK